MGVDVFSEDFRPVALFFYSEERIVRTFESLLSFKRRVSLFADARRIEQPRLLVSVMSLRCRLFTGAGGLEAGAEQLLDEGFEVFDFRCNPCQVVGV